MMVRCEICGLVYNDTYRWTNCPHDGFECSPTARAALIEMGVPPDEPPEDAPQREREVECWPTHCIHARPIAREGEGPWCPDCEAANLATEPPTDPFQH
jgi:hypothetical protein